MTTGFNAFQYAADKPAALREAARVTRAGGFVVSAVWGDPERCDMAGYLAALGGLTKPPPGAPGPFALSPPGVLETLLTEAGLPAEAAREVDLVFAFKDEATAVAGLLAPGPAVRAIQVAGEDAAREAVMAAVAPYRTPGGGYRMLNRFRLLFSRIP